MTSIDESIGSHFKRIRKNKGYTQDYIAENIMSRSTYTKIESDLITPGVVKYFQILNSLDMDHAEFSYIQNNYQLNAKENILYQFKSVATNSNLDIILKLQRDTETYLSKANDNVVNDILQVCRALTILSKTNDLKQAFPYAKKVWDRISTLDKWYLTELRLLNNILFFFSFETSLFISRRALNELANYRHFNEARELRLAFEMNVVYLLMENKDFTQALEYVDPLIKESKSSAKYLMLAALYIRKGIILKKIDPDFDIEEFHTRGFAILDAIEENHIKKDLLAEISYYLEPSENE